MPTLQKSKTPPPVTFPRNGTPPDKDGYPHYAEIGAANARWRAQYDRLLAARRQERQKLLTAGTPAARRSRWTKRRQEVRAGMAKCLGLAISRGRREPPKLCFQRATVIGALGHILPETNAPLRADWFSVPGASWDGGAFELLVLRPTGVKIQAGVLLIPNAGPGLVGGQSPESAASEWGCALASAGFVVAIPRLPGLEKFSTTHNKARMLEGACALGEIVGESARALDALFTLPSMKGLAAWAAGAGTGALAATFLGALDGRVAGVLADAPVRWGTPKDTHAIVVPFSHPLTDQHEVCAAIAPRPLALVRAGTVGDAYTPPLADVRTLAKSAQPAYSLLKGASRLAVFAATEKKRTVEWLLKQTASLKGGEPGIVVRGVRPVRSFAAANYMSAADWKRDAAKLRREYRRRCGIPPVSVPLSSRLMSMTELPDCTREEFHIRTGEHTYSNVTFLRPKGSRYPRTTILHLPGSGSDVAKVERNFAHEIVAEGWNAVIIDARVALYPFHPGIAENQAMISQSLHDLICCLDWVCSRDDVDVDNIGTMGVSQGGTHSWMLAAMDDRIAAAAPVCGVCTYRSVIDNHRTEWYDGAYLSFLDSHSIYYYTPGVLEIADQQDLCALCAPRPFMLIGGNHDNCFPLDGMRECARDLRHIYGLMKASDNFEYVEFEGPHSMPEHTRRTAYKFFRRHLT